MMHQDSEAIIVSTVAKYRRHYGGSYQDLYEEGYNCFVDACMTYDEDRGTSFSTWVNWKVWRGLRRRAWILAHQKPRPKRVSVSWDAVEDTEDGPSRFRSLYSELSSDAKYTVGLALKLYDRPLRTETARTRVLSGLRKKFERYGWEVPRITGSFNEIRRAIRYE